MSISRFRAPAPPVHRASTVLFDSVEHLDEVRVGMKTRQRGATMYGTFGTPTTEVLADLILAKEGGDGVAFAPSGLAAVTLSLLSVVRRGGHLLVTDTAYGPTREFCDTVLARFGVTTEYYDPMIGAGIARLLRPETVAVFMESPGSFTFEVQDAPGMVAAVRRETRDVALILDNAWGSPGLFRPLAHDVDICVLPLTKYWGGHADLLLGAVVASNRLWPVVQDAAYALGVCTNGDEAALAIRGARSVETRLRQHERSAMEIATWLSRHPRVGAIRHPAFPGSPGHEFFKRDFSGSNGLFSFELRSRAGGPASVPDVAAFTDRLISTGRFGLGYSWGGYESLVMPAVLPGGANIVRTVTAPSLEPLVRLHIGLEPVDQIRDALAAALA